MNNNKRVRDIFFIRRGKKRSIALLWGVFLPKYSEKSSLNSY
ncbi:MAG: hypothetical protein ACI9XO_000784 [Paraglaciecola sp.]|jgi:hypothetical protein